MSPEILQNAVINFSQHRCQTHTARATNEIFILLPMLQCEARIRFVIYGRLNLDRVFETKKYDAFPNRICENFCVQISNVFEQAILSILKIRVDFCQLSLQAAFFQTQETLHIRKQLIHLPLFSPLLLSCLSFPRSLSLSLSAMLPFASQS